MTSIQTSFSEWLDCSSGKPYLEQLSVVVHEEQHQSLNLGTAEILVLDDSFLEHSADQGPVFSLEQNRMSLDQGHTVGQQYALPRGSVP